MPMFDLTFRLVVEDEDELRRYMREHEPNIDMTQPLDQLFRLFMVLQIDRACRWTAPDVPFSIHGSRIEQGPEIIRCGEDVPG